MLPAFRVKGIWPKQAVPNRSDSIVVSAGASLPQEKDSVLQLPKNKYDEFIIGHPECRLKYVDEDKETIIIGSELELVQKLQERVLRPVPNIEDTPMSTLDGCVKFPDNPAFYTAVTDRMHGFHIEDDEAPRKLWSFVERATFNRNHPAHKVWDHREMIDPPTRRLLHQYIYEFVKGYDFEGFNSHYNFLSDAGRQLKEIAAKFDSKLPEQTSTTLESQDTLSQTTSNVAASAPIELASTQPLSAAEKQARLDSISIQLDEQLEDARQRTEELERRVNAQQIPQADIRQDGAVQPSSERSFKEERFDSKTTNGNTIGQQLDVQLEVAKAVSKVLDDQTSSKNKTLACEVMTGKEQVVCSSDSQREREEGMVPYLPTMKSTPGVASPTVEEMNAIWDGMQEEARQPQYLTDVGRKASQEAGLKLRDRQYDWPRTLAVARHHDTNQWMVASSDPSTQKGSTKPQSNLFAPTHQSDAVFQNSESPIAINQSMSGQVLQSVANPQKKKLVRFSDPPSIGGCWNLDGSYSPGSQSSDPITSEQHSSTQTKQTQGPFSLQPTATQIQADKASTSKSTFQEPCSSSPFSTVEVVKLKQIMKFFDDRARTLVSRNASSNDKRAQHNIVTVTTSSTSVQDTMTNRSPEADRAETNATAKVPVPTDVPSPANELERPRNHDCAEVMVAKLWCQTMDNITSNLETFASQVDFVIQSKIDRKQARLDSALEESGSRVSEEDRSAIKNSMQRIENLKEFGNKMKVVSGNVKQWNNSTKVLLNDSDMFNGQTLSTSCFKETFQNLANLKQDVGKPFYSAMLESFQFRSKLHETDIGVSSQKPKARIEDNNSTTEKVEAPKITETKHGKDIKSATPNSLRNARSAPDLKSFSKSSMHLDSDAKPLASIPSLVPSNISPSTQMITDRAKAQKDDITPSTLTSELEPGLVPMHNLHDTALSVASGNLPTWRMTNQTLRTADVNPTTATSVGSRASCHPVYSGPPVTWTMQPIAPTIRRPVSISQAQQSSVTPQDPVFNTATATRRVDRPVTFSMPIKHNPDVQKAAFAHTPQQSSASALTSGANTARNISQNKPSVSVEVQRPHLTLDDFLQRQTIGDQPAKVTTPAYISSGEAGRITDCVEVLKALGYGSSAAGGDARLVVYAQAAEGNLDKAIDIIEEEQKVYEQQKDEIDALYD